MEPSLKSEKQEKSSRKPSEQKCLDTEAEIFVILTIDFLLFKRFFVLRTFKPTSSKTTSNLSCKQKKVVCDEMGDG